MAPSRRQLLAAAAAIAAIPSSYAVFGRVRAYVSRNEEAYGDPRFRVCGNAEDRPCDETDVPTDIEGYGGEFVGSEEMISDGASIVFHDDTIEVAGRATGIGDENCRKTELDSVTVEDGTLSIAVLSRSEPPLGGFCRESTDVSYYLLEIDTGEDDIEAVELRHYSEDDRRLEATVSR